MKLILIQITTLFFIALNAQIYIPIDTANKEQRDLDSEKYLAQNKVFLKNLETKYDRKLYKFISSNFKELHDEFNTEIKEGQIVYHDKLNAMVTKIIKKLQTKNPEIPKDLRFYILKDGSVNAASFGDNTIVFNLGLFYYLNNEDQLASVVAHEIGHQILNHSSERMTYIYNLKHSKTRKKKVKNIKKEKYKKGEKAFTLLKNMLYFEKEVSRKREYEADSIGYVLYRNTDYNNNEFINALKTLELYDTIKPKGLKIESYKTFFDLPKQAFKEKWLNKEDFSTYNYDNFKEKINLDSIATHPEIEKRILNIKTKFPDIIETEQAAPSEEFKKLFKIAKMERIPNLYFNESYGNVIYLALLNLQRKPDDLFYKQWIGKGFTKIYESRKNYTANRYIDRIDPKNQSESYQQFLSFMWNLSLEEIKNISDYYNSL